MIGALANGSFARIWIGQLVSQIGDKFYAIALALWIADGRGGPAVMAAFLAASALPGLLAGPFAGALADRWSRKAVMIGADLARAAAIGAVAILFALGRLEVWEVVAAAVLVSIASAFFNPALSASLPLVVGEDSLGEANSLSQVGGGITGVLGPACGAVVLGCFGYEAVFSFDAASFIASAALIAAAGVPRGARSARIALARSVKEGFDYARGNRAVLSTLAVVAIVHLGMGSLSVALPFLAGALEGKAARNLGLIEALTGLGIVVGSLVASRLAGKAGGALPFAALIALGAVFCSLGLLEAAGARVLAPFLACAAVIGACVATAAASWTTCLQKGTPDDLRGRIFGLSSAFGNASLPLGMAIAGLALERYRIGGFIAPLGALMAAAGALLAVRSGIAGRPKGRSERVKI